MADQQPGGGTPPVDIAAFMEYMINSQNAATAMVQELRDQNVVLRGQSAQLLARMEALELGSVGKGEGKGISTGYGSPSAASFQSGAAGEADRILLKVTHPFKLKRRSQWPSRLINFRPFCRRLSPLLQGLMTRADERDESTIGGEFLYSAALTEEEKQANSYLYDALIGL